VNGRPQVVANRLLGALLMVTSEAGTCTLRITETEAYGGLRDPASHAYRGRTNRNQTMFGPAGRLYVYRSHGLHWCCNVTVGTEDEPMAVLLRSGEVIGGIELARTRRPGVNDLKLARGPGNLTQALGITGADDGTPISLLSDPEDVRPGRPRLQLVASPRRRRRSRGPRVGVSVAADVPWRFFLTDDPTVSSYRRSPRAPHSR
jgi:DNA-3-methyladenine glycosylase